MSYSISVFIGNQMNTDQGQIRNFEKFEHLASIFKKCRKGSKHSSYVVRGALEPMDRKDANLKSSKLVFLDGDAGVDGGNAPRPELVHKLFKELGINHFIYTSHSHSRDQNKFRVVLPTEAFDRSGLEARVKYLCAILNDAHLGIEYVKEMRTWSQPWFTPTRDDPEDGLYEFYEYHNGVEFEVTENEQESKTEEKEAEAEEYQKGDSPTLEALYENIRTGHEYHESLLNITWQLAKAGQEAPHIIEFARSVLNNSEDAGSKRWQDRWDEVPRMVKEAIAKQVAKEELDEEFELEGINKSEVSGFMPKPPGMLGELYECAYDFLLYQYPEVAIASAIGVVAGITGRKFNMSQPIPSGLNVFLTVIASTGCGKDRINDFANMCIRGGDGIKSYDSFIGPSYFTSPKAIINQFTDARSRLCIVSEAGMMLKVKSGNVEGTTAFVLDALQCSHSRGYTKEHAYSDADNGMPSLRAMAMTIVSESTPEQMYEAYASTGALTSGYLPRQTLLKIGKRQTVMNRNVKQDLPGNLMSRLQELLETCSSVQAEADPKAYLMHFDDGLEDDFYDYSQKYNEISADNEEIDSVKQHMATRAAQKAIKLAGIATVFNKRKSDKKSLIVEKREWEWAKAFCDYEYQHITSALSGLSGNQGLDNACFSVYTKMMNIISNNIKDKKCQIDTRYRKKKLIPYSNLKIACKNNKNVNDITDKTGKMISGLDKVLLDMLDKKAIKIHDRDPLGGRSPKVIQVLPGANEYAKHFGI